jgi:hypothetical protein
MPDSKNIRADCGLKTTRMVAATSAVRLRMYSGITNFILLEFVLPKYMTLCVQLKFSPTKLSLENLQASGIMFAR